MKGDINTHTELPYMCIKLIKQWGVSTKNILFVSSVSVLDASHRKSQERG